MKLFHICVGYEASSYIMGLPKTEPSKVHYQIPELQRCQSMSGGKCKMQFRTETGVSGAESLTKVERQRVRKTKAVMVGSE